MTPTPITNQYFLQEKYGIKRVVEDALHSAYDRTILHSDDKRGVASSWAANCFGKPSVSFCARPCKNLLSVDLDVMIMSSVEVENESIFANGVKE